MTKSQQPDSICVNQAFTNTFEFARIQRFESTSHVGKLLFHLPAQVGILNINLGLLPQHIQR